MLHLAFCDYCSTIEGESELSRNKHWTTQIPTIHHICTFTIEAETSQEKGHLQGIIVVAEIGVPSNSRCRSGSRANTNGDRIRC